MRSKTFDTDLIALKDSLTKFAYSLSPDSDDARDLVQDTFLKALSSNGQYDDKSNLRAWLFAIMRNTFINNYRRNITHTLTFDSSDNQFIINSRPGPNNAESSYALIEINCMIDALESELRIPFRMHTFGYKYKEIAEALGLKIGTVKSRIFFSRRKLMESLKDYRD
ncbi:MAG: RNA polymerase sigma factor [Prevotellaceae bacterium]|jgi:RNA polymerase sigma-70 factor (ECF subfamily)|nr:RNA polymerase sigma factor [Prevotellaceae bacterium]